VVLGAMRSTWSTTVTFSDDQGRGATPATPGRPDLWRLQL